MITAGLIEPLRMKQIRVIKHITTDTYNRSVLSRISKVERAIQLINDYVTEKRKQMKKMCKNWIKKKKNMH